MTVCSPRKSIFDFVKFNIPICSLTIPRKFEITYVILQSFTERVIKTNATKLSTHTYQGWLKQIPYKKWTKTLRKCYSNPNLLIKNSCPSKKG